jgi:hypothetical protein
MPRRAKETKVRIQYRRSARRPATTLLGADKFRITGVIRSDCGSGCGRRNEDRIADASTIAVF